MNRKRLVRWLCGIAIALAIGVVLTRPVALACVGRWLDVGSPPQKADAIFMFNGGDNTRPLVAAALLHGGWAGKLIVNIVDSNPQQAAGIVPKSNDIVAKMLDYGEAPRERVVWLPSNAATTYDEVRALADYLKANPVRRILLVTEWPHTRRAEWIFRNTLADRGVEITMISAPTDDFDAATWWQSEPGFLFVVSEYFKLLFYALRYGWLGFEIAGVAAVCLIYAWLRRRRKLAPR